MRTDRDRTRNQPQQEVKLKIKAPALPKKHTQSKRKARKQKLDSMVAAGKLRKAKPTQKAQIDSAAYDTRRANLAARRQVAADKRVEWRTRHGKGDLSAQRQAARQRIDRQRSGGQGASGEPAALTVSYLPA